MEIFKAFQVEHTESKEIQTGLVTYMYLSPENPKKTRRLLELSNQVKDIWMAFCAVYIARARPEGQIMLFFFLTVLPKKIEAK